MQTTQLKKIVITLAFVPPWLLPSAGTACLGNNIRDVMDVCRQLELAFVDWLQAAVLNLRALRANS